MEDWSGYIRCDYCRNRLKFDLRIPYHDLNLCGSCINIVNEKKKTMKKNLNITDEFNYKRNLDDKPKQQKRIKNDRK